MNLWATLLIAKVPTKKHEFTFLGLIKPVYQHKAIFGSRDFYPVKFLYTACLAGMPDDAPSHPVVMAPHCVWHRNIFWLNDIC